MHQIKKNTSIKRDLKREFLHTTTVSQQYRNTKVRKMDRSTTEKVQQRRRGRGKKHESSGSVYIEKASLFVYLVMEMAFACIRNGNTFVRSVKVVPFVSITYGKAIVRCVKVAPSVSIT